MGFGIGHPDLALYRLIKGGDSGLNLGIDDLLDRYIEVPSLFTIIKSLFTREKIIIKIKAYPNKLIEKLLTIQRGVDKKIEEEVAKAKDKGGL